MATVALALLGCGHRSPRIDQGGPGGRGLAPLIEAWQDRRPNEIVDVALGANAAYATTVGNAIRVWDLRSPGLRAFEARGLPSLAPDGSVSVNVVRGSGRGDEVDVWELATGRRVVTRAFDEHVDHVVAVSRTLVLLELEYARDPRDSHEPMPAVLPPCCHTVAWDLAAGEAGEAKSNQRCDGASALTADARGLACASQWGGGVSWIDRATGRWSAATLAPDWWPPEPPVARSGDVVFRGKPRSPRPPPFALLSARLARSGDAVYVTYSGTGDDRRGWRLERWRPANASGGWERLAEHASDRDDTQVLAASADGNLVVLGGRLRPLTVRRAPRFDAQPLAAASANAAAVSATGDRIVTGHEDGRLMLWDARTGALLASAR